MRATSKNVAVFVGLVAVSLLTGCGSPKLGAVIPGMPGVALTRSQISAQLGETGAKKPSLLTDVSAKDFSSLDRNHDGKLSRDEFATGMYETTFGKKPSVWDRDETRKMYEGSFQGLDQDHDGFVAANEFDKTGTAADAPTVTPSLQVSPTIADSPLAQVSTAEPTVADAALSTASTDDSK